LSLSPDTSVLITGTSGALGWVLARRLSAACRVTGTYFSHECVPEGVAPMRMDLTDAASVAAALDTARPQVIVHAAAMTDPDACERDPAAATAVNVAGCARLVEHARRLGSKVVYISTDLVFDGVRGDYAEDDKARPLSVYGRSKLDAEGVVLRERRTGRPAVIRSSLIYGWGSPASGTFFSAVHAALRAGGRMRLFTDQLRNPILEADIAAAVILVIERDLEGLYHAGGPESVSRLEFGKAVCDVFGFDERLLEPIAMQDFEYEAARPLDSTLNISRLAHAAGFAPRGLMEGLAHLRSSEPD